MPIFLPPTSRCPPHAASIVLWNPDVLDPSTTILRITYISVNGLEPSIAAIRSATSRDFSSGGVGGFSSSSIMQTHGPV